MQRESFDVIGKVGFDHDFGVSRCAPNSQPVSIWKSAVEGRQVSVFVSDGFLSFMQ